MIRIDLVMYAEDDQAADEALLSFNKRDRVLVEKRRRFVSPAELRRLALSYLATAKLAEIHDAGGAP